MSRATTTTNHQSIGDESADLQGDLAATYQAGAQAAELLASARLRGSAASAARRKVREGEVALGTLMESLQGLIYLLSSEYAKARLGEEWARTVGDDVRAEATLAAVEAVRAFDATRGRTVAQWVAREIRNHLRTLEFDSGGGTRPREWQKVAKVAHAITQKHALAGRKVSAEVLTAEVWDHFFQETCTRIMDDAPELNTAEVEKRANARLSRQSLTRAINRELGAIVATSGGAVSLNVPTEAEDGELIDLLPGADRLTPELDAALIVRRLLGTLPESTIEMYLSAQGGSVPMAVSRAYSDDYGVTQAQARAELNSLSGRFLAPHAQFCALWDGLEHQVERSDCFGTGDVLSLLDAARSRH